MRQDVNKQNKNIAILRLLETGCCATVWLYDNCCATGKKLLETKLQSQESILTNWSSKPHPKRYDFNFKN